MRRLQLDDTIAAIATAPGEGAIAMVRLSGPDSLRIAWEVFRPTSRRLRAEGGWESRRLYHGHVVDPHSGQLADEVMATYLRAPHTYTRQDMVEITGHGGAIAARETLRIVVAAGARLAEPGEMTLRAFLSGRIDLSQAEAVLDAVRARTPAALAAAVHQIGGGLSQQVRLIRGAILEVMAHLEATIDFVEDDVPPPAAAQLEEPLLAAQVRLGELLATARSGRLLRDGIRVVIVGRPNAGKSSLLNALLQEDRAIVTPVAGTTRDVIEESLDLAGIPIVLSDTAGIVTTSDPVEAIGVERSRRALERADLALFTIDGGQPLTPADEAVARLIRDAQVSSVVVVNKHDLPLHVSGSALHRLAGTAPVCFVSALNGTGLEALRAAMRDTAYGAPAGGVARAELAGAIISSARHRDALERASQALADAIHAAEQGVAADFIAIDLRAALGALGEITGEEVTEDLLSTIFSHFCIGK